MIGNATTLSYTDNAPEAGSITYGVSAVYSGNMESAVIRNTIFITEYLAPVNPTAKYIETSGVEVQWEVPVYEQVIYWGNGEAKLSIGFGGVPFYFGHVWSDEELVSFHNNKLNAIQFAPARGVKYKLFIKQANREYTQDVINPTYDRLNNIKLTTPFIIGSGDLIVSVYAYDYTSRLYPAYCDNGPAVNMKGNLISEDGINWEYLYDESDDNYFNYNFFLGAVISSEKGILNRTQTSSDEMDIILNKSGIKPLTTKASPANSMIRSQMPAEFPEITGYNIYRDNIKVNPTPVTDTKYVHNVFGESGSYKYAVSALYGNIESGKTEIRGELIVGNEKINIHQISITPTLFDNYITITNASEVNILEIISIDGKLVKRINSPEAIVNTTALAKGIYLFRIITNKNSIVIKGVKK